MFIWTVGDILGLVFLTIMIIVGVSMMGWSWIQKLIRRWRKR